MPDYLSLVMQVAADEGVSITFSQARYTARRIAKRDDARDAIDPYAYVLQHMDDTGEIACGFKDNPFTTTTNHTNAARRLAAA